MKIVSAIESSRLAVTYLPVSDLAPGPRNVRNHLFPPLSNGLLSRCYGSIASFLMDALEILAQPQPFGQTFPVTFRHFSFGMKWWEGPRIE